MGRREGGQAQRGQAQDLPLQVGGEDGEPEDRATTGAAFALNPDFTPMGLDDVPDNG